MLTTARKVSIHGLVGAGKGSVLKLILADIIKLHEEKSLRKALYIIMVSFVSFLQCFYGGC